MFYTKEGYPEENELVLCTVTNVQYNSVFCNLDFYARSGMIHISEVSPGRIRNIRDYVVEGKKVICKVLRINEEKGHIDLSLRRVTENQKRELNALIKQEQKAEKIIENLAAELKEDPKKLYLAIANPIFEEYEYIHMAFQDHVEGDVDLAKFDIPKEYQTPLIERVVDKIKPKSVTIGGKLMLETFEPNGISLIRKALESAEKTKNTSISYLGSGKYKLTVTAEDYRAAEALLDEAVKKASVIEQSEGGKASFART